MKYLEVMISAERFQSSFRVITVAVAESRSPDLNEVIELVTNDLDDWDSDDADVTHKVRELGARPKDIDFLICDDGELIESPREGELSLEEAKGENREMCE